MFLYRSVHPFTLKHERGRKNTTFLLFNIMGKLFEYSFPCTLHNENLIVLLLGRVNESFAQMSLLKIRYSEKQLPSLFYDVLSYLVITQNDM